jgi:hypothetical protein
VRAGAGGPDLATALAQLIAEAERDSVIITGDDVDVDR